jgi:hypothetical protein
MLSFCHSAALPDSERKIMAPLLPDLSGTSAYWLEPLRINVAEIGQFVERIEGHSRDKQPQKETELVKFQIGHERR